MAKNLKLILLLSVAVFLIIGSGIFSSYSQNSKQLFAEKSLHFKNSLIEESVSLKIELNRFLGIVNKNKPDDLWIKNLKYFNQKEKEGKSFFIVKHKKMVFWSDNNVSLPIKSTLQNGIHFFGNGWYLVERKDFADYSLFALMLIRTEFEQENSFLFNRFNSAFSLPNEWSLSKNPIQESTLIQHLNGNDVYLNYIPNQGYQINYFLVFLEILALTLLLIVPFYFQGKWKVLLSLFYLFGLRIILFFTEYPINSKTLKLFQPELYAASDFIPSLGDLILHYVFFSLSCVLIYRTKAVYLNFLKGPTKFILSFCLLLFLTVGLVLILESLFQYSKISFDLSDFSTINVYTIIALFFVFMIIATFYVFSKKIISAFFRKYSFVFYIGLIFCLVVIFLLFKLLSIWMLLWIVFLLLILTYKIYRNINASYLNYIPEIIVTTFFLSLIFNQELSRQESEKLKLLIENKSEEKDPIAEFLLSELAKDFIKSPLKDSLVLNKYLDKFLPKYLGKYNYSIHRTSESNIDRLLSNQIETIDQYLSHYRNDILNSYVLKIPINKSEFLVVDFKPKEVPESIGFPLLLMNSSLEKKVLDSRYSYAKYSKQKLAEQSGIFNFSWSQKFYPKLNDKQFLDFKINGFRHFLYQNQGDLFVITQKDKGFWSIMSNFTYLMFFFVLLVFIGDIFFRIYFKKELIVNDFKSRFQFSLIFSLFFSMALIAWVSIYYLKEQFNYKNFDSISEKIKSVQLDLIKNYNSFEDNQVLSKELSETHLNNLSSTFFTDLNLFDTSGKLIASSQNKLFESGLISNQMNAHAYFEISLNNKMHFIQEEKIENMTYLSAYAPVYNKNGSVLAYINLPYFAKTSELKNEINGFLLTLVNIYFLLIIFTMLLTLLIANRITAPLRMIKDKISKISISQTNELIEWSGKDELGAVIQEYNKKVMELSDNALKLAKAEREGAWKEMAKQVAHEIKNPLTPMKLNIQHFQMVWNQLSEEEKTERFSVFSKNILEQIDTLSAIASQFSNFATLPEANFAVLDLIPLIESSTGVYEGSDSFSIKIVSSEVKAFIHADKDQILRVFNNLIKNAHQAIPENRKGVLTVKLNFQDNYFLIVFEDNGIGISDNIKEKVFQPNFTTKSSGMGLGLAMGQRLVQNNNGSIWYETQEGKGTSFYLKFPAYKTNF